MFRTLSLTINVHSPVRLLERNSFYRRLIGHVEACRKVRYRSPAIVMTLQRRIIGRIVHPRKYAFTSSDSDHKLLVSLRKTSCSV